MNYKKVIMSALLLAGGLTAGAQQPDSIPATQGNPFSTVVKKRMLPRVTSKIHLLTRS